MNPVSINEVRNLIQQHYSKVWSDWYSGLSGVTKAKIEVPCSDLSAAYSHLRNLLIVPIGEGNLEDYDILDETAWNIWRIQLIHEMLHEWQMKKPCKATPESERLYQQYGKKFWGEGHGPDFFQAIIEKADYFGMTPEQLIKQI